MVSTKTSAVKKKTWGKANCKQERKVEKLPHCYFYTHSRGSERSQSTSKPINSNKNISRSGARGNNSPISKRERLLIIVPASHVGNYVACIRVRAPVNDNSARGQRPFREAFLKVPGRYREHAEISNYPQRYYERTQRPRGLPCHMCSRRGLNE